MPRDVPGFAEAYDAGLLPKVPKVPPNDPASGLTPTASALMWRFVARAVATGVVSVGFLFGITNAHGSTCSNATAAISHVT